MQLDHLDLNQKNQAQNRLMRGFILAQLILTIVLSVLLLIYNFTAAYSALAGGLIATMANAWFALKVFRVKSKEIPETLLATFYVGEIYKFVLTGALFVMVFVLVKPLNVVALLGIYFLIHMTPAVMNVFDRDAQANQIAGNVIDKES